MHGNLGFQASQLQNGNVLKKWLLFGQPKIVLKVDSLEEIEKLEQEARALGIVAKFVQDAGKTQVCETILLSLMCR